MDGMKPIPFRKSWGTLERKAISDVQENIAIVQDSTDHLMQMMKKIQIHLQDIVLDENVFDVGNVLQKAISMISPFAKEKNISIVTGVDMGCTLKGDELHLKEVFINILKNAIESMDMNGAISIDIFRTKKIVSIWISDNGKGIPKDNLPHVIEPFFSTRHKTGNDWACTNYFTTGEDICHIKRTKDIEHWEDGLRYMIKLVEKYFEEGRYSSVLKRATGVGIGFVDGDINIVYYQ